MQQQTQSGAPYSARFRSQTFSLPTLSHLDQLLVHSSMNNYQITRSYPTNLIFNLKTLFLNNIHFTNSP
ncbi:putative inactive receptor kinase [Sesbania bispinosa]|nr:putative inactive receptor kinase [Sesbania bispinosa]